MTIGIPLLSVLIFAYAMLADRLDRTILTALCCFSASALRLVR
ncbi:hypothetical protein [Ruegeria sp. ANG-R]|nr:hypothetical protein [Ruegeria sp. ANG-R]